MFQITPSDTQTRLLFPLPRRLHPERQCTEPGRDECVGFRTKGPPCCLFWKLAAPSLGEVKGSWPCWHHTSYWGPALRAFPGAQRRARRRRRLGAACQRAGGRLWLHLPAASGHLPVPEAGGRWVCFCPVRSGLRAGNGSLLLHAQNARPPLGVLGTGNHLASQEDRLASLVKHG